MKSATRNEAQELAWQYIRYTDQLLFITGKAGTGKTTFLRELREKLDRRMVVVAPTGVAAINAGGVTMHAFFQLPFGPFLPQTQTGWGLQSQSADLNSLLANIRFTTEKRELLQELELLVIDEVSMLRADMLDATDQVLRHFRKKPDLPFGGVQVLFIGDLFQLPPVINGTEWEILRPYYKSPFFFEAQVLQAHPPVAIEFMHIYRQRDEPFIALLQAVREARLSPQHQDWLDERLIGQTELPPDELIITLTTHNARADLINQEALAKLPDDLHRFEAQVKGEFSDRSFPAERDLQLKIGAQVMFLKNDKGENRRYFNGKLATVSAIKHDAILVDLQDGQEPLEVKREVWRNIKYEFNREEQTIEEEELGTFTQFPLRLAWAITIHKSQGLTFDRSIIDAEAAFAGGQVYVALSRLRTLEGMYLSTRIPASAITTDGRVLAFARSMPGLEQLRQQLVQSRLHHYQARILQAFDLRILISQYTTHLDAFEHRMFPGKESARRLAMKWMTEITQLEDIAARFRQQLQTLLADNGQAYLLQERLKAGQHYFQKEIKKKLEDPLLKHQDRISAEKKTKKYVADLAQMIQVVERVQAAMENAVEVAKEIVEGESAVAEGRNSA
jgi:ATP-dependent exoDNAse (exonuclease V) alpha subunit